MRSSTENGGGSASLSTSTVQSPISTSPVPRPGLTVPSGRARTVPVTAMTHSLRTSVAWSITHCTMPVLSRRSTKARCSPCSRRRATHPHSRTVVPMSAVRRTPHRCVRMAVGRFGSAVSSSSVALMGCRRRRFRSRARSVSGPCNGDGGAGRRRCPIPRRTPRWRDSS